MWLLLLPPAFDAAASVGPVLLPLLLLLGVFFVANIYVRKNVHDIWYPYSKILRMFQFVVVVVVVVVLLLLFVAVCVSVCCRSRCVFFILRDMVLCQACGMPLTGTNVAAIEAATAAGPSYAYTDTRSSLLNFGRWRR